ncbi:uncharacterized protein DUF4352 [Aureibacillus halotolerans]|uniref:Uncharacterized protein DUF4352 n=1 Tax=Aureibacillus halotolerans TaxID=1508390 RepID=A0A4R6UAX9_9BACI|nr:uncharacterized protein DUF4352 [Aureibacillus halotolerans]
MSEITFPKTLDGEKPDGQGIFIVAVLEIKNMSDEPIDAEEVADAWLINVKDDIRVENRSYYEEVKNFEGNIQPGESLQGELAFYELPSEQYQIKIGHSTYSNVLLWNFMGPNNEQ